MNPFSLLVLVIFFLVLTTFPAYAHCDTLDGPVIADAKKALAAKDVTTVLKWLKQDQEKEVRQVFAGALEIIEKMPKAKSFAENYLFETLVRIHRAGEGAPYTGLKPAGEVEPMIKMADEAIEKGDVDALTEAAAHHVVHGIKERFARVRKFHKTKDKSVAEGRRFVEAYVDFVHYAERIHGVAVGAAGHEGQAETGHGVTEHKH